jgi:hypothetical protein
VGVAQIFAFIDLGLGVHATRMGRSAHLKKTWKLVKTLCKKRKNRTVYIVDKILKKEIQSAGCVLVR